MTKQSIINILILSIFCLACSTYVWDQLNIPAKKSTITSINRSNIQIPNSSKPQIIHFWAFNHPLSKNSLAYLNKLDSQAKAQNVELVVVCLNWSGSELEIKDYLTKNGYQFDVILDKDNVLATNFSITSLPQTQIVNKSGIITHRLMGLREDINFVDEILKKATSGK